MSLKKYNGLNKLENYLVLSVPLTHNVPHSLLSLNYLQFYLHYIIKRHKNPIRTLFFWKHETFRVTSFFHKHHYLSPSKFQQKINLLSEGGERTAQTNNIISQTPFQQEKHPIPFDATKKQHDSFLFKNIPPRKKTGKGVKFAECSSITQELQCKKNSNPHSVEVIKYYYGHK